ncbi:MAG: purine-nucleoside phosphorylase [Saprospiraceae bacterium]|nr:purine-nucleoside phosphorylase [Saprospiraceae bacterium]
MLDKIKETTDYILNNISEKPQVGIILGTGLGNLGEEIEISQTLSYKDIPNFPVSTVSGHKGQLIFGKLGGKNVVAMQGRFHYYEGYTMKELTFPIRVFKFLGIEALIVSNAAGGMNPEFEIGDLMIITDHINLMSSNPLMGPNEDKLGPRFPDMHEAYSKDLIAKAKKAANDNNISFRTGVYAAVSGPTFETPAEYNYIRIIGADAVGMSTVPEVIVARHMDIPCFAVSVITDLGVAGQVHEVSHEEVIKAAKNAEPKMTLMIKELIAAL